jgi:hypothetical protein
MNRWFSFLLCCVLGLAAVISGFLIPAYLRATDTSVIEHAGRSTPGFIQTGLDLVKARQLGAAQWLSETAQFQSIVGRGELRAAIEGLAAREPNLRFWGSPSPRLDYLFKKPSGTNQVLEPFTAFLVRQENRTRALEFLQEARAPAVQELLRSRNLTNTTLFSPSSSSSGQAFDAAVTLCGLLVSQGQLGPGLSNSVLSLATQANHGGNTQSYEQLLLDLVSLGQRLNWGQLTIFVGQIPDAETLRLLSALIRKDESSLPVLFSAVVLSERPAGVIRYLMDSSQTGLRDLRDALRYGPAGIRELLGSNQRLHHSPYQQHIAVALATDLPWIALGLKWTLLVAGAFLLAMAVHFARPSLSALELPLQVRGIHIARELLFSLGFLVVVLLLTEPFLSQESQKVDFPFRLRLPQIGSAIAGKTSVSNSIMNQLSLLTLLLFLVLQSLLYVASLVKLAEVRRQNAPARIKLRLLDNEDHLFDAGLYLGFVGTIISLILVSLGVIKPSLMAAYSSTSFGIIFVSIFKIFNLRPLRRQLLLEAENLPAEVYSPTPTPSAVRPS